MTFTTDGVHPCRCGEEDLHDLQVSQKWNECKSQKFCLRLYTGCTVHIMKVFDGIKSILFLESYHWWAKNVTFFLRVALEEKPQGY